MGTMKTIGLTIVVWLILAGRVPAQNGGGTGEMQVSPSLIKQVDDYVKFQTSLPGRIYGINVRYQGLIPMATKVKNPLQLINPLAPREYGDAYQNVILDPATKQQQGIKVFEARF